MEIPMKTNCAMTRYQRENFDELVFYLENNVELQPKHKAWLTMCLKKTGQFSGITDKQRRLMVCLDRAYRKNMLSKTILAKNKKSHK